MRPRADMESAPTNRKANLFPHRRRGAFYMLPCSFILSRLWRAHKAPLQTTVCRSVGADAGIGPQCCRITHHRGRAETALPLSLWIGILVLGRRHHGLMWMLLQGSLPHPLPREPPPRGGLSFKRRRAFKASLCETDSPDTGEVARSARRGAVARSAGGRDFAFTTRQSAIRYCPSSFWCSSARRHRQRPAVRQCR